MKRREFITIVGGAAATWPFTARAQQPMPVIGFIHILSPENVPHFVAAFRLGLREIGFVEGQNVIVEYRWAQGHYDRLPELAADLVRRQVSVIAATGGDPSPQIAKAATQTIPIIFTANGDPVKDGLVASFKKPGGNATGITIFGAEVVTKRLQLLHELVPNASAIFYMMNPNNPNGDIELNSAEAAAHSLGKEIHVLRASNENELDIAFATMAQQQGNGLLVASDTFFLRRRNQIVSLVARHRIPAIYYLREFAHAGGLMTYGNNLTDMYRLVGLYVGRILKGEKPANLPVQRSTKFEFVINVKTAKALGIELPQNLLVATDEVIE